MLSLYYINNQIPNEIRILVNNEEEFNFNIPIEANILTKDVGAISVNDLKVPSNQIKIDLNKPFTIQSSQTGNYSVKLKLFGLIKFKDISLDIIDEVELIPCGSPVGIYVETNGVLVLGSGRVTGLDGLNYEPVNNRLKSGDYITSVNGQEINNKKELVDEIQTSKGKDIVLGVRRGKENITVKISPIKTTDNSYKIGAWIRDDTQGVGTLTFISTSGHFGALGHGVTDIDTGLLMDIKDGAIYSANIMSIVKGKEGEPGELIGSIKYSDKYKVGNILSNTNQGIFGKIEEKNMELFDNKPLEIGLKQDVKKGEAYILCTVDDKVEKFEIEIEKTDIRNSSNTKGIVIKITDERLLEKTGGIVQGMSGSPIVQNDKLIGAVTHVFIQDSTKGYGTFIENMVNKLE